MSRFPLYLRKAFQPSGCSGQVRETLDQWQLNTVCEEAHCPNRAECFSHGTATFMIMGNICTRNCQFCAVGYGQPLPLDPEEPQRLAQAVNALRLKYVVITSVTRDDLPLGGAEHFQNCILRIKPLCPHVEIEVLVPDFNGLRRAVELIVQAQPRVFNHNVETVPRLYPQIRPQADYPRSLNVLKWAKEIDPQLLTKSGMMVGLGESPDEVYETMTELRAVGCELLTLGQYLAPSTAHYPIKEFITPEQFQTYAAEAKKLGFTAVASGPFVRSSYLAHELTTSCS